MATNPDPSVIFTPTNGVGRPLMSWLTTFHLTFVAVDPYARESRAIIPTAARLLTTFEQSDTRVAWVATAEPAVCAGFLGKWSDEILTFADPDRAIVKSFGLEHLPALVHVAMDATVGGAAEGWDPDEWQKVLDALAEMTSWSAPVLPAPGDPAPFVGSPV